MKEEVLHGFWHPKNLGRNQFNLVNNQILEVENFGELNLLQGPDFNGFSGKIDGQFFAGLMEMHWKSSDWLKHNHSVDSKYDNVILHVVWEDDLKLEPIRNKAGQILPTLELSRFFSKKDLQKVQMKKSENLLCESVFHSQSNQFEIKQSLENQKLKAVFKKIELQKSKIRVILESTQHDWEQTAWIWLGSYWVDPQNRLSAERVFRSVSLNKMKRGNWEEVLVEILYRFGLFEATPDLPIFRQIIPLVQNKFSCLEDQLKDKKELLPWYHGKVRYHNYPLVKFIQYLSFVASQEGHLTEIFNDENTWRSLGQGHQVIDYKFGFLRMSDDQIFRIASNAWLPLFLVYRENKDHKLSDEKIIELLRNWKPESNVMVQKYSKIEGAPKNAFDSFSRISMWQNWCSVKNCSNCEIGRAIWNL